MSDPRYRDLHKAAEAHMRKHGPAKTYELIGRYAFVPSFYLVDVPPQYRARLIAEFEKETKPEPNRKSMTLRLVVS